MHMYTVYWYYTYIWLYATRAHTHTEASAHDTQYANPEKASIRDDQNCASSALTLTLAG